MPLRLAAWPKLLCSLFWLKMAVPVLGPSQAECRTWDPGRLNLLTSVRICISVIFLCFSMFANHQFDTSTLTAVTEVYLVARILHRPNVIVMLTQDVPRFPDDQSNLPNDSNKCWNEGPGVAVTDYRSAKRLRSMLLGKELRSAAQRVPGSASLSLLEAVLFLMNAESLLNVWTSCWCLVLAVQLSDFQSRDLPD